MTQRLDCTSAMDGVSSETQSNDTFYYCRGKKHIKIYHINHFM
jgi:hypothetical protein